MPFTGKSAHAQAAAIASCDRKLKGSFGLLGYFISHTFDRATFISLPSAQTVLTLREQWIADSPFGRERSTPKHAFLVRRGRCYHVEDLASQRRLRTGLPACSLILLVSKLGVATQARRNSLLNPDSPAAISAGPRFGMLRRW